jgi:hypothetical protein
MSSDATGERSNNATRSIGMSANAALGHPPRDGSGEREASDRAQACRHRARLRRREHRQGRERRRERNKENKRPRIADAGPFLRRSARHWLWSPPFPLSGSRNRLVKPLEPLEPGVAAISEPMLGGGGAAGRGLLAGRALAAGLRLAAAVFADFLAAFFAVFFALRFAEAFIPLFLRAGAARFVFFAFFVFDRFAFFAMIVLLPISGCLSIAQWWTKCTRK